MSENSPALVKGDWIVHTYYGVGQIEGVEKKQIGEEHTNYFKVQARNSIYFVPVDNAINDRVRKVASTYKIRKAIKILQDSPGALDPDHNKRKRQIAEMASDGSLEMTAQLVRDLYARRYIKGLNDHEETLLSKMSGRFVYEWSISKKTDIDSIQEKFNDIIAKQFPIE